MNTVLFRTSENDIRAAAAVLADGGLVAFPTETVYGLGADAFCPTAAQKAYAAKGRPSDNPLIVHIAHLEDLKRLCPKEVAELPMIKKLADTFWPGPLTVVLPKLDCVPKETTGGLDTVAVRMPKDEATLKLIEYSGTLVSGPSANKSGGPSPTSWQHVQKDLDGKIEGILCGNPCDGGIESTVLDLTPLCEGKENPVLSILRPGLITPEMISAVTGLEVSYDAALLAKPKTDEKGNATSDPNFKPKAPGMKYKHYSPNADVTLVIGDAKDKRVEELFKEKTLCGKGKILCPSMHSFYGDLRDADEEGLDFIIAVLPKDDSSLAFSLMNRAVKAAGYNIIELD
ncbi:MAG: threonylcarbamoyl-AMP synthase [Clostridia bacterium]|nr:threonylcarbamoyl-AMP synthase [Clostridia bacterium]